MVRQKYQPHSKPFSCPGVAHDDFVDGENFSDRHPAGNVPASLGPAADAIFTRTRSPPLFLCVEDNPAAIQISTEGFASLQPCIAPTSHSCFRDQRKYPHNCSYLFDINLSATKPGLTAPRVYFDDNVPVSVPSTHSKFLPTIATRSDG